MDSPPISVVIPAFNAGAFLPAAVQSVLNQSYGSFELLIIDDASSDVTPRIAQAYAARDARVHYYRNPANLGVARSRNRGVALAQHSWIAFLDSDDRWRQDKLARQVAYLQIHPVDLVYTGYDFMDTAGRKIRSCFHVPESIAYPQLLRQNLISCSGILVRKRWCQQFPMNPSVFHEDFLDWLSMLRQGAAAGGIDLPLHTVRIGRLRSKSGNKLRSAAANVQTYRFLGLSSAQTAFYMLCYLRRSLVKYGKICLAPRHSEGGPAL